MWQGRQWEHQRSDAVRTEMPRMQTHTHYLLFKSFSELGTVHGKVMLLFMSHVN